MVTEDRYVVTLKGGIYVLIHEDKAGAESGIIFEDTALHTSRENARRFADEANAELAERRTRDND